MACTHVNKDGLVKIAPYPNVADRFEHTTRTYWPKSIRNVQTTANARQLAAFAKKTGQETIAKSTKTKTVKALLIKTLFNRTANATKSRLAVISALWYFVIMIAQLMDSVSGMGSVSAIKDIRDRIVVFWRLTLIGLGDWVFEI